MTITSGGNVGIGTTSPATNLEISDASGSVLTLRRADTYLGSGNVIGDINFDADVAGSTIASIKGRAEETGTTKSFLAFYTNNGSSTTQSMRIDSSGNVGIGVTAPASALQVAGDILPSADNTGVIGNTAYTWANGQFTNLSVNSTLTVVSTLNVRSAIDLADSDVLRFGSSDDFKMYYDGAANEMEFEMEASCNQIRVHDNGTTRFTFARSTGNFTATGDVVAYSDARVKENVKTIDNALDKIMSMRGVSYNRTDTEDKTKKVGVIAQEIQQVLPEVVLVQADGMLGVSYGNIFGVLIEAIKEQQQQIDELKKRLDGVTN